MQSRPRPERRARSGPAKTPRRAAGSRRATLFGIGLVLAVTWASAATWMAVQGRRSLAQQAESSAEMRRAYEDKVRALTRRLVGVASHQVLEQDGLEGRMADIITRQVELENRQATLTQLAEQAGATPSLTPVATAPGPATPPFAADSGSAAAAPAMKTRSLDGPPRTGTSDPAPSLKLGPPGGQSPDPVGSDFMRLRPEDLAPAPGRASNTSSRLSPALPLREQFAALEASLDKVAAGQVRALQGLARASLGQMALIRSALVDVGLEPDRLLPAARKANTGGPFVPVATNRRTADPFEGELATVQADLAVLATWRPVTETVPFRRPVAGENNLTSNFGVRSDPFTGASAMHAGMDFRAGIGTPARATAAGRVVTAEWSGGYGNLVEIDHGHGLATRYGHLSEISVERGRTVAPGTVVGLVGSTGRSTGPHLHYETRIGGAAVDPMRFLKVGARLFAAPGPAATPAESPEPAPAADQAAD